jgi:hypothetical protein
MAKIVRGPLRVCPSRSESIRGPEHQEAERFNDELSEAVIESFSKIDYNRVRRIASRFRTQQNEIEMIEYQSSFEVPPDLVFRLTDNYAELLDEIERSGLEPILVEYSDRIEFFVSRDTLPSLDSQAGESEEQDDIGKMISVIKERNQIVQTRSGRDSLEQITAEKVIPAETVERDQQSLTAPSEADRVRVRARRMRKIAALGKAALGGALTATNIGLGITTGVVTALPTLGVGTVGAAAGLVASSATGVNYVCDGLKEYATILEEGATGAR